MLQKHVQLRKNYYSNHTEDKCKCHTSTHLLACNQQDCVSCQGKNTIRKDTKVSCNRGGIILLKCTCMPVYVIQHQFFLIKTKHLQYYNDDCNGVLYCNALLYGDQSPFTCQQIIFIFSHIHLDLISQLPYPCFGEADSGRWCRVINISDSTGLKFRLESL